MCSENNYILAPKMAVNVILDGFGSYDHNMYFRVLEQLKVYKVNIFSCSQFEDLFYYLHNI